MCPCAVPPTCACLIHDSLIHASPTKKLHARLFESAKALCASPDVDAVYVLTNMQTHLQYAKMVRAQHTHNTRMP